MPEKIISSRQPTEHVVPLRDGTELFYRAWAPSAPSHRAIVLFHRGHEHSARWQDLVDRIVRLHQTRLAWLMRPYL